MSSFKSYRKNKDRHFKQNIYEKKLHITQKAILHNQLTLLFLSSLCTNAEKARFLSTFWQLQMGRSEMGVGEAEFTCNVYSLTQAAL